MHLADLRSLLEQRRSVRYFSDKPVTKKEVEELLALGHLAPSVENLQPWRFHVVLNKDLRAKFHDACCYGNFVAGASVFIIVTCDRSVQNAAKEVVWNERELEYSCMAAMMNIIDGATAMGLGSCWVSLLRGEVHEVLKLPRHEIAVGGIMLGHLKRGEEEAAGEHQRGPLRDKVIFHE